MSRFVWFSFLVSRLELFFVLLVRLHVCNICVCISQLSIGIAASYITCFPVGVLLSNKQYNLEPCMHQRAKVTASFFRTVSNVSRYV